jgi:hypothetical protein
MKPKKIATAHDGAELWVNGRNADGTYTGYIHQVNGIRRSVRDISQSLASERWLHNEDVNEYATPTIKPRKPKKPTVLVHHDFDRPIGKHKNGPPRSR